MSKLQEPKTQLISATQTEPTASSQKGAPGKPSPQAWIAVGTIDRDGRRCDDPKDVALTIVAVCVHERCSTEVNDRIKLMHEVVARYEPSILPNVLSLWIFPAGYLGFNAEANLNPRELAEIVERFPAGAWIAFGVDSSDEQQAWVVQRKQTDNGEWVKPTKIIRNSEPRNQCVELDDQGFKAAFFVCDDVKSYSSEKFKDYRLIVDLAHIRVKGLVNKAYVCDKDKRRVHQKALERAGVHSAAVLTHHHAGDLIGKRAKEEHQSNWILFRGAEPNWLSAEEVLDVP